MPFALILIGAIFMIAAMRGQHKELFDLLKSDFTGPNNFVFWGMSVVALSSIGYWKPIKPIANAFFLLVTIAVIMKNDNFFSLFMQQIRATENAPTV